MQNLKIQTYIISELQNEIFELERRVAFFEATATPKLWFFIHKLQELFWTVTRLCGFAHWHDGSRAARTVLLNSRNYPQLFPTTARARIGGCVSTNPGQRLLIDVTDTVRCGVLSGIQRVVLKVATAAVESGAGIPVFIQDGHLFSYLRHSSTLDEIEIAEGDKFIMADASWNNVHACQTIMELISRKRGSNIVILHDILPLVYPGLFHPDNVRNVEIWFDKIVLNSDAVVAVSKSVAEEFLAFVAANKKPINPSLRVGWQNLGADFEIDPEQAVSDQVAAICSSAPPFFLSVSTLEPKKGYTIALDAMDRLWERGVNVRYVIVGRYGWNARALVQRIVSHPEYNRRLFWRGEVNEPDLRHLYKNAHSLIFASVAEGFGLPLVEAAHFGLPVIASDIPIFRETGGDAVSYFDVTDSESLSARLHEALAGSRTADAPPHVLTWQEATDDLFKLIKKNAYQFHNF